MRHLFSFIFALLCVSIVRAQSSAPHVLAHKEILKRERKFDRSKTSNLYRMMHRRLNKTEEQPAMTFLSYNPFAQRLREAIYTQEDIVNETDASTAYKRIQDAIEGLPKRQRDAVQRLPFRSLNEAEPVSQRANISLPTEVSDMVYAQALRYHLCKALRLPKHSAVQTMVERAVKRGRVSMIDYLMWLRADPNLPDEDGLSLLSHAVKSNNVRMVDKLLFYGADPFWSYPSGEPLLHDAVELTTKRVPMARRFLHTVDLSYQTRRGEPLTMSAIYYDDVALLDMLLQCGADPHFRNDQGQTLLFFAVVWGARQSAEYLIAHGSDTSGEDQAGQSYLEHAVAIHHIDTALLLLRHGANQVNRGGRHILLLALHVRLPGKPLRRLAKHVNVSASGAVEALLQALTFDLVITATVLLEAGVDPNGTVGTLPILFILLRLGKRGMAEHLVTHGADLDVLVQGCPLYRHPELLRCSQTRQWLAEHEEHV